MRQFVGRGLHCAPFCRLLLLGIAGRHSCPGTWKYLAHLDEHFLGLLLALEIAHVQSKALAMILAATRDEKSVVLELRVIGLRQCHRRGRCHQVDDKPTSRALCCATD
jgi:hypothetical protein